MSWHNVLAIETSTAACSVALGAADHIHVRHEIAMRRHTELLVGMLDGVIADAGIDRSDLNLIAYGRGPGSFTGVRVAAATAQGIATALGIPCVGVSTLETIALGTHRETEATRILVAQDARRAQLYVGAYDVSRDEVIVDAQVLDPEQIKAPDSGKWLRAGDGWQQYASRLPAAVGKLPLTDFAGPRAADMISLALRDAQQGRTVSPAAALPLYLRGATD